MELLKDQQMRGAVTAQLNSKLLDFRLIEPVSIGLDHELLRQKSTNVTPQHIKLGRGHIARAW
jgi:hypothetical protein